MDPVKEPIAEKCPGCGYILDPETGTCLHCGYKPCQFCLDEDAGNEKS